MLLAFKWFVPITVVSMALAFCSEQVALLLGFEPPPQDLVKIFTDPNVHWTTKTKYAVIALALAPVLEELVFRQGLFRFCIWCGKVMRREPVHFDIGICRNLFYATVLCLNGAVIAAYWSLKFCSVFLIIWIGWIIVSIYRKLYAYRTWNRTSSFPYVPALISGAVFAAVHLHAVTFLPLWFLGVSFAWLYWKSGSIFSSMTCHFLFNAMNLVLCLTIGMKST